MAYREFHNEEYYEAPDVGIVERGLRDMNNTIADQLRAASEAKKAKALAADQFKFDLGQGKFENDDKIFFEAGKNVTARGRDEMKRYGALSPELQKDQQMHQVNKNASDWQFQAMTDMVKQIDQKAKEDTYYDDSYDRPIVKDAAYGENNDVYYSTRGDRLIEASKKLFRNPNSFKGRLYTADYAKTYGAVQNTKTSEDPTQKSSTYMSTPFIDAKGVPGVTTDQAKQYLNSRPDGSVARWVENLVDEKMKEEVAYTKEHNANLKGMSDADAINYLKLHPEENAVDKTLYSDRVISKAKSELMESVGLNRKTDYETKVDKTITGGTHNNDYISNSYAQQSEDIGEEGGADLFVARTIGGPKNNMPGGVLRIAKGTKVGQAIPLDMNPQYMVNLRNGKLSDNAGSTTFNMTGYQMGAFTKDGKPRIINQDVIDKMRPSDFANLAPELGIVFRGHTINQGNKLGELAARQSELDGALADAKANNDIDKIGSIEDNLEDLKKLREQFNLSPTEFSDDDALSAMRQKGINVSSIKQDVLIKPSAQDLQTVNSATRGLDLLNPEKHSPEMKQAQELYKKKYQEAAAKGFKDGGGQKSPMAPSNVQRPVGKPVQIKTAAEWEKLPSGTRYVDPKGVTRTKP